MDLTNLSVAVAASTSTSLMLPATPNTSTINPRTSSAGPVGGPDGHQTPSQKHDDKHFFARWICGDRDYDMKWLSPEENEDLRRAERAKLSHEELEKLVFEEPY